jgi:hypothetical protein
LTIGEQSTETGTVGSKSAPQTQRLVHPSPPSHCSLPSTISLPQIGPTITLAQSRDIGIVGINPGLH